MENNNEHLDASLKYGVIYANDFHQSQQIAKANVLINILTSNNWSLGGGKREPLLSLANRSTVEEKLMEIIKGF